MLIGHIGGRNLFLHFCYVLLRSLVKSAIISYQKSYNLLIGVLIRVL